MNDSNDNSIKPAEPDNSPMPSARPSPKPGELIMFNGMTHAEWTRAVGQEMVDNLNRLDREEMAEILKNQKRTEP